MAVVISSFGPPRARAGEAVTIAGTGFGATTPENTVTVNGVSAAISSASPTSLAITIPLGVGALDRFVDVLVSNLTTAQSAASPIFIRLPALTDGARRLPAKQVLASRFDNVASEVALRPEGKDFERLSAYAESWMRNVLAGTGGAARIGSAASAFASFLAASDDVAGALAAIDTALAAIVSNAGVRSVFAGAQATGHTLAGTIPVGMLAADGDAVHVVAVAKPAGIFLTTAILSVFGTALPNIGGAFTGGILIHAIIYRVSASSCLVIAENRGNFSTALPVVVGAVSGSISLTCSTAHVLSLRALKTGQEFPFPEAPSSVGVGVILQRTTDTGARAANAAPFNWDDVAAVVYDDASFFDPLSPSLVTIPASVGVDPVLALITYSLPIDYAGDAFNHFGSTRVYKNGAILNRNRGTYLVGDFAANGFYDTHNGAMIVQAMAGDTFALALGDEGGSGPTAKASTRFTLHILGPVTGARGHISADLTDSGPDGQNEVLPIDVEDWDTEGWHEGVTHPNRFTNPSLTDPAYVIAWGTGAINIINNHDSESWLVHRDAAGTFLYYAIASHGVFWGNFGWPGVGNVAGVFKLAVGDFMDLELYNTGAGSARGPGASSSYAQGGVTDVITDATSIGVWPVPGTPSGVAVEQSIAVTVNQGANMPYNTETFDTDGWWEGVTHPDRFTVPAGFDGRDVFVFAVCARETRAEKHLAEILHYDSGGALLEIVAAAGSYYFVATKYAYCNPCGVARVAVGDYFVVRRSWPIGTASATSYGRAGLIVLPNA